MDLLADLGHKEQNLDLLGLPADLDLKAQLLDLPDHLADPVLPALRAVMALLAVLAHKAEADLLELLDLVDRLALLGIQADQELVDRLAL